MTGEHFVTTHRDHLAEQILRGFSHRFNNISQSILLSGQMLVELWTGIIPLLEQYHAAHGDYAIAGIQYSGLDKEVKSFLDAVVEAASGCNHAAY